MLARCPECDAEIMLSDSVVVCEVVICPECTIELEVIATDPLELALAPEIEEDWGE